MTGNKAPSLLSYMVKAGTGVRNPDSRKAVTQRRGVLATIVLLLRGLWVSITIVVTVYAIWIAFTGARFPLSSRFWRYALNTSDPDTGLTTRKGNPSQ